MSRYEGFNHTLFSAMVARFDFIFHRFSAASLRWRLPDRSSLRLWCAGVVLFGFVLSGVACSNRKNARHPAVRPAVIIVENHTGYDWRIAFTSIAPAAAGSEAAVPSWIDVSARATRRVELVEGAYRVRRALVAEAAPLDDQGVELIFENGRIYTWPLGTLLSSEGVEP